MSDPTSTSRRVRAVSLLTLRASAVAIVPIGLRFLLRPEAAQAGYGLPTAPDDPYLAVKGVRDVVSGLVLLTALARRDHRLAGASGLAATMTPVGDMLVVLRRGGPRSVAFGVHGATALVMAAAAVSLLAGGDTER